MYTKALPVLAFFRLSAAYVIPDTSIGNRQAAACFIIGDTVLPQEVADVAAALAPVVTCDPTQTTLEGVPDVISQNIYFSANDFSQSQSSPLQFALDTFATADPLADTDLAKFQALLDVYTATEAGVRSVGGNVNGIKVPKFFLSMQVQRIQTAQGNPPVAAGQQVDHLRDKVTKNAAAEDKALLDQVVQLATVLA